MAKTKKLLSLALAVVMVSSLFCLPASADAHWSCSFDMSAMMGSSDYGRHGSTTSTDYNVIGVYGKGNDGVLQLNASSTTSDYYLGILGSSDRFTFSANSKTVISYDVAFDSFAGDSNNHVSLIQLANSAGTQIGALNFVHVNKAGTMYALDQVVSASVKTGCWNNITAVIDLGSDSKAYTCTVYLNGEQINTRSFTLSEEAAYVRALRICDRSVGGKVYVDNLKLASYPSTDTVNLAFTTASAATTGNESIVDHTEKTVTADYTTTVADFNSKTTGFVVLDASGNVPADEAKLVGNTVYAVYKNDINSYYEEYAITAEPPAITAVAANFEEFVDLNAKEIRLVDIPDTTVGEFKAAVTELNGAELSITKNGAEAADGDLLSACVVKAVINSEGEEVAATTYTLVTARSYALENEAFDGSFTERTGTGKVYSANDLSWTGHLQSASNVTFKTLAGLGGKSADDKSAAIVVNNTTTKGTPMLYVEGNPYFTAKNENIGKTFTVESKIYIANTNDKFTSVDIIVHGRKAATLLSGGSVKAVDASTDVTSTVGSWTEGTWIPVAVTYHKGTSSANHEMDVYIAGVKVDQPWKCGLPSASEIRFVANCEVGASVTLAVDDVKLYTDSLEKYKYTVSGNTVTLNATDSLKCVPILATYNEDGTLADVELGTDSKTVTIDYADGQSVKAMLWESLSTLVPIVESITIVDRGNPVNSYTAVLSAAFTDNMVLQRDMPVTIWGTSADANGSTLSVSLGDETKTAYVNDGEWEVAFSEREASSEGEMLTVTTAVGTQTVENIAFGDVYFVGGQSNAYLPMNAVDTYNDDKASFTASDDIRIFHQVGDYSAVAQANPIAGSKWEYATESTIGKMSAIGMYFAKTLRNSGVDVPIGLISVARSGSSLHWNLPKSITDKYQINYMTDRTNQAYNALLAPVENFSAKGMLWYQGENDSIKGSTDVISQSTEIYDDMFSDFHAYLKEKTNNNDFKIFSVQLSSHSTVMDATNPTTSWQLPRFRSYQFDMVKNMDNVYIVPSLDCGFRNGDTDPAHPIYKKPIGERLAKAALYAIYNKETENNALAPMPETVSYDGGTVTIKFKHTGTGLLIANGTELKGFELIDENGNAYNATAQLSGTDTVIITSASVTQAEGVRYAFYRSAPVTIANLASSSGLPCLTFAHDKDSDNGISSAAIAEISLGEMLNK